MEEKANHDSPTVLAPLVRAAASGQAAHLRSSLRVAWAVSAVSRAYRATAPYQHWRQRESMNYDELIASLDRARINLRDEWMADLWPDNVAAAALETLTDAAIEIIHLRDKEEKVKD